MTRDVRLEVSEEQHEWLTELKSVAFLPAPRDGVSCLVNHEKVETAVDALEGFAKKCHQDILTTLLSEMAVAETEGNIQHEFVDSHLNRIVKISNVDMKKKQLKN